MPMSCDIDTCDTPAVCRGWCQKHYVRWRRTGDPLGLRRPLHVPPPRPVRPKRERWDERVDKSDGCWLWTGAKSSLGYGQLRTGNPGTNEMAHRLSWEFHRGEIPVGLHVLHHCDTPSCVRPDHLWLGTPKDNALDRQQKGRQNRRSGDLRKTVPTKANGRWRPKYSRHPRPEG